VPPDVSRRRFLILGVVWLSYLLVYLARLSVGALSPYLKDAFDLNSAEIGALMSATAITYAPTLIVAGWLVDRVGVRRMLVAGTLIASLCIIVMYWAPSYGVLLGLLALSSLGAGCIYPSAVRAVMLWFPVAERATAIGVNQTAINVSGIIAAVTLPSIAEHWGWQYGLLVVGLAGLAVTALVIVGYRSPRTAGPGSRGTPAAPSRPPRGTFRGLLRHRDVRLLAGMGFFLGIVEYSVLAQIVLYMTDDFLLSAVAAGGVLALAQGAGAVAKPLTGLMSDRLLGGRRRPVLVAMGALSLAMCLVLAVAGAGLDWAVYVVVALLGLAAIGWGGVFGTMAGEIGGRAAAGQVAGLTAAAVNIGIVVGPPAFGAIVDASGSYGLAWLAMAVSSALAIACVAFAHEPREHDPAARVEFEEA
jgi:MFS transporter, ACS family, hexuronate transporter